MATSFASQQDRARDPECHKGPQGGLRPSDRFGRCRALARSGSLRPRHRRSGVVPRPATVVPAQKVPGSSTTDRFLYDDSFLHDHVSRSTLRAHGDAIELNSGVAQGLARLAGLLKPALQIMWVNDVRRMNKFLDAEVPDVAGHLFGRERTALTAVRQPFKEAFDPHCFYCGTHLPDNNPIDHVLPWSLVSIDGLSNLVLACARCNGDKSRALPAAGIVDRVLRRERDALEEIAATLQWPTQHERVVAAARGIYRGQPAGVPTWSGYKRTERLDISFLPRWMQPDS
jgi:5-methylcytosine-specific restriction endonuclease McrA